MSIPFPQLKTCDPNDFNVFDLLVKNDIFKGYKELEKDINNKSRLLIWLKNILDLDHPYNKVPGMFFPFKKYYHSYRIFSREKLNSSIGKEMFIKNWFYVMKLYVYHNKYYQNDDFSNHKFKLEFYSDEDDHLVRIYPLMGDIKIRYMIVRNESLCHQNKVTKYPAWNDDEIPLRDLLKDMNDIIYSKVKDEYIVEMEKVYTIRCNNTCDISEHEICFNYEMNRKVVVIDQGEDFDWVLFDSGIYYFIVLFKYQDYFRKMLYATELNQQKRYNIGDHKEDRELKEFFPGYSWWSDEIYLGCLIYDIPKIIDIRMIDKFLNNYMKDKEDTNTNKKRKVINS
jgi:hypothetical protein